MVKDGHFGFKEYFKPLCDTLEGGSDFYLLGSDFASYLEAQVIIIEYLAPFRNCICNCGTNNAMIICLFLKVSA